LEKPPFFLKIQTVTRQSARLPLFMPVQTTAFFSFVTVDFCFTLLLNTGHSTESFGEVDRIYAGFKMNIAGGYVKTGPASGFETEHTMVVYYNQ
jgi:hypothetical protein